MTHVAVDDLGQTLRRWYIDAFLDREVTSWTTCQTVLDLGGNRIGKRGRFDFNHFSHRVVCVNLVPDKRPDVQADAAAIPFRGQAFDAVVCAELLEHVYRPEAVLREVARVLRPGGVLLLTVPFLVHRHADPADYGRYTGEFWFRLLTDLEFDEIRVEAQGAFWSVLLDMLRNYLLYRKSCRRGWWAQVWLSLLERGVVCGRRKVLGVEQTMVGHPFFSRYATGFGVTASKRQDGSGPPRTVADAQT